MRAAHMELGHCTKFICAVFQLFDLKIINVCLAIILKVNKSYWAPIQSCLVFIVFS